MPNTIQLLRDMIAIPSVNPMRANSGESVEQAMANFVENVLASANYGTDGSKLARAGIQTVVCGPGDIAQAHTANEFIEIEQVELATRMYRRLLAN